MSDLLQQVLALPNGARFYRVDLHNHTPADNAFNCGNCAVDTEEQKMEFARTYVRFLKEEQGIEIVGITEHNDVSWLPYLQAAALDVGLILFPGVEVNALAGNHTVHFLALFDPGTEARFIDEWLSLIGLTSAKRFYNGNCCAVPDLQPHQLIERIHTAQTEVGVQAIALAAHSTSKHGLLIALGGKARVQAYTSPYLLALEIPGPREALDDFQGDLVEGRKSDYANKRIACLNHSDGRGLRDAPKGRLSVGERFTNIKLSAVSVEALRQAFIDFDSRIRLEGEYHQERYPRLLGMIVENGFLAQKEDNHTGPFMLHFNPNLNTLIGGRGTGKSSVLEAMRYCFDLLPRTDATRKQAQEIVNKTLLEKGAKVTVYYEMTDGTRYRIVRAGGREPEVFDVATGDRRDIHPRRILPQGEPLEIYGQKEIYEISNDITFQLNLLDTYIAEELYNIEHEESDLLRWLKSNAATILRLQDEIAESAQRVQELAAVRLELERMERHQAVAQLESKKIADREHFLLKQTEQAVHTAQEKVAAFRETWEPLREWLPTDIGREQLPNTDLIEAQATLLARIDHEVKSTLTALVSKITADWQQGAVERAAWEKAYRAIEQEYEQLLKDLGQDFSTERYFAQRAKLQTLETIQQEIDKRKVRLEELGDERNIVLEQLQSLWRLRQFRARCKKAQYLTTQLKGAVRVSLEFEGNREAYAKYLRELLAGRRITRVIFEQLAAARLPGLNGASESEIYANPTHLAQAIRRERQKPAEGESILETIYGISVAYRERLAAIEDEILYTLETYRVPDRPDICLKVGDHYRSLKPGPGEPGLSTGQKCTVILSLILVERNAPLIIDQPEDDLDNEFIYREIVQTLRREKRRRQFIIATHNANIPVSGDAELIVALQADEHHGWVEHIGSIDDPEMRRPVEDILEGGKEAFEFRQKKYQILE